MPEQFLEALAKPQPVPGGGAAAAYGASVGLALLEKIVRLELLRKPLVSEMRLLWEELLEQVCGLATTLVRLRIEDGKTYMRFAEARDFGREEKSVIAALGQAVESPLKIMETATAGLSCASQTGKDCKKHLLSDLLVVCELLQAGSFGAFRIAQANLLVMGDASLRGEYRSRLRRLRDRCRDSFQQVESAILVRTGAVEE